MTPALVGGTSGVMVGNIVQALFGRMNNAPLGAALSVVMMLTVTVLVSALLWSSGYRRTKLQEP